MKINELIQSFEIYKTNEEIELLDKMDVKLQPLSSYTEYFSELRYFIENKFEFWQLNYMYENIVNKEVDFSSLTNNTPNNIFIYILFYQFCNSFIHAKT